MSAVLFSLVFALAIVATSIEVLEMEELAKAYVVPILITIMFTSSIAISTLLASRF